MFCVARPSQDKIQTLATSSGIVTILLKSLGLYKFGVIFFLSLTLTGMRESDFVTWIFIKHFHIFVEVKIDINRVNLTPYQAHQAL